jgi:hypothetical protein
MKENKSRDDDDDVPWSYSPLRVWNFQPIAGLTLTRLQTKLKDNPVRKVTGSL